MAAQLAQSQSVPLWLVHVVQVRTPAAIATARRALQDALVPLGRSGAAVEPLVLQGFDAVRAVVDFMRDETPSLVVVSAATKSPLDRWAPGSFSERLAQSAPIPTLVVRDPAPFHRWGWTKERLRVLAALDLKAGSDGVLRWLRGPGCVGPYDLIPCHVRRRWKPVGEMSSAAPQIPPVELQRLQRDLKKQVRDQLGEDFPAVTVRATNGSIGACLIETARENKAQLVVVGTHQRHGLALQFHGSVSRELLRDSNLNVLCVPTGAKFDPGDAHVPQFHRVVVATDFSELGNAAIPFACGVGCIGGLVKIIHVAPPTRRASAATPRELRAQLRALVPRETGARCQPPDVDVIEDRDVARGICAEAERFGADVVCLASHGMGASRALQGSVTKAVLTRIRRPVLVVRRPEE